MISLFVKVNGELQRYETGYWAPDAHSTVQALRSELRGSLPAKIKSMSPVLALIENKEYTHDQMVFGF